jgi:L-threonylcarbamoyladenylate synthase
MKRFTSVNNPEVVQLLRAGGIGVLRTDTLYGVVASASNEAAVRRVFELKGRSENKSPIVLISENKQLFDPIHRTIEAVLGKVWPGPVSVIIPSKRAPLWIRRGNDSVAYRLPNNNDLRALIEQTGPLIAPSANPQGEVPAMTSDEAYKYFGDQVDFYVDGGQVTDSSPSQLLLIGDNGKVTRLR